ncbi:MAG: hypothetical protein WAZ60_03385 [Desulfosalsimonadaceae bacterium]
MKHDDLQGTSAYPFPAKIPQAGYFGFLSIRKNVKKPGNHQVRENLINEQYGNR